MDRTTGIGQTLAPARRILVTGAQGQLGLEVTDALRRHGVAAVCPMSRTELDITDRDRVYETVRRGGFTYIVNCAGYTAVDRAESDPELCRRINVDGARHLAEAAAATNARMIHISTDYVFDGTKRSPYTETDTARPLSVYGLSKYDSETAVTEAAPDAVILRTGWLYSPRGHNFVRTILRKAAAGTPLSVVADQTGTPTSAAGLAELITAITADIEFPAGIYNYADEGSVTWYDFARETVRLSPFDVPVRPCATADYPAAAIRPAYSVLDKTKIKTITDTVIRPWQVSLAETIARMDFTTL